MAVAGLSFSRVSHHFGLCEWGHSFACAARLKTFVGKAANLLRVYRTCHDTPHCWVNNYDSDEKELHEVLTTRED
jgi:hypothetical protein